MTRVRLAMVFIFTAFGLVVASLLAYLALGAVDTYEIHCDRARDECRLIQRQLMGSIETRVPLHAVTSAAVIVSSGRRGPPRVFLMLLSGHESFFAAEYEGFNAEDDARATAALTKDFIADTTRQSLQLEVSHPILTAIAWCLGVLVLLFVVGAGVAVYRNVAKMV